MSPDQSEKRIIMHDYPNKLSGYGPDVSPAKPPPQLIFINQVENGYTLQHHLNYTDKTYIAHNITQVAMLVDDLLSGNLSDVPQKR